MASWAVIFVLFLAFECMQLPARNVPSDAENLIAKIVVPNEEQVLHASAPASDSPSSPALKTKRISSMVVLVAFPEWKVTLVSLVAFRWNWQIWRVWRVGGIGCVAGLGTGGLGGVGGSAGGAGGSTLPSP
ncbi:hypothetical protein NC652_009996 [Populus alba x Populus x berolinensis]|nr:hypothetical protein NC652_009996 [Populus alba x Populus x berolinensis]